MLNPIIPRTENLGRGKKIQFQRFAPTATFIGFFLASIAFAQFPAIPTTADLPCSEPDANLFENARDSGQPDNEGFYSLFNGTFEGWFQNCKTSHSIGSDSGAIIRIGKVEGKPAIYLNERNGLNGGVLMSHKKFRNYEITFQIWPEFGSVAGLLHRVTTNGRSYQTTLGYGSGLSFGGAWGEGGFSSTDIRPFSFQTNSETISIPGGGSGGGAFNWTRATAFIKASTEPNLPCPTDGCTQSDWNQLWNKQGWNSIRVQFYGAADSGSGNIHMKSWFKKPTELNWVPVLQDSNLQTQVPPNPIGFLVHGGGDFSPESHGLWLRDIRWKPLSDRGETLVVTSLQKKPSKVRIFQNKNHLPKILEQLNRDVLGVGKSQAKRKSDANQLVGPP